MIPTQEDFQFDLTERVRGAVQATIQVILDEELERLVGAGPYERSDSVSTFGMAGTTGAW